MKLVQDKYTISWVDYEEDLDESNSNLDIHVKFNNGSKYVATFFTLKNIQSLFEKNKKTGECSSGTYFWASDMILITELSSENILKTVQDLIEQGEFEMAFEGPFQED